MDSLTIIEVLSARGIIPQKRVKDFKTSLQKLADASRVQVLTLNLSDTIAADESTIKAYFDHLSPAPSVYTIRNTLQNVRQLHRLAAEHGLLPHGFGPGRPKRLSHKGLIKEISAGSLYKSRWSHERYMVRSDQWPEEITEHWTRYMDDRGLELRDKSKGNYEKLMACYVGWNLLVEKPPVVRWDQLFEPARCLRFMTWHAKRVGVSRVTTFGVAVFKLIAMLAEYFDRPELAGLRKRLKKMPKPTPMHQKKRPEHTFTIEELDSVGVALIEKSQQPAKHRSPAEIKRHKHPGLHRALTYQMGLIIRLWIRVPMRIRSIREMDMGGRLYRDGHGRWQLVYVGDQLKVDTREGQTNEFRVAWPADLVDELETYLTQYRILFPHAATCPYVFPSGAGGMIGEFALGHRLCYAIYRALGKRIWPHLIRTIWSDAYLDANPGDWEGAAAMLNNTPQMVMLAYRNFRREQHLQKAVDFNAKFFGNGYGKGKTP